MLQAHDTAAARPPPARLVWSVVSLGFLSVLCLFAALTLGVVIGLLADGLWLEREIQAAFAHADRTLEAGVLEPVLLWVGAGACAAGGYLAARWAPHAPRLHAVASVLFTLTFLGLLTGGDAAETTPGWIDASAVVLALAAGEGVRRSTRRERR